LSEPTYGKRLHAAARKDFKAYWSAHRWWATSVTLTVSCLAIVIQILYQGAGSMANIEQTAVTGIVGLAVSLIGNYLISMRRGAEALDGGRISEIEKRDAENRAIREVSAAQSSELRRQIEQLAPPKRTQSEEYHYTKARDGLKNVGKRGEMMLQYLEIHGKLMLNSTGYPPVILPGGMTPQQARECLDECLSASLVTRESIHKQGFGISPVQEDSYQIAPGMKAALDELLYPPKSS
jgi:hypothetical protein